MEELAAIERVAQRAAAEGGRVLMACFRRVRKVVAKSPFEMVTEADVASEEAIIAEIRRSYPSHTIRSEEQGELAGDDARVWIVDPLDGTLKFILGEPYFSVSVAYEEEGVVRLGMIFNPYTQDVYLARRGGGAFKNGVALQVAPVDDLAETFVCCDWGGSPGLQQQGLGYLSRLLPPTTRGVGVNFSPALDLCNLAEGTVAAVISNGTTPEDHAAGALIVSEAGGGVVNFGQTAWSQRARGIVATNTPAIFERVARLLDEQR